MRDNESKEKTNRIHYLSTDPSRSIADERPDPVRRLRCLLRVPSLLSIASMRWSRCALTKSRRQAGRLFPAVLSRRSLLPLGQIAGGPPASANDRHPPLRELSTTKLLSGPFPCIHRAALLKPLGDQKPSDARHSTPASTKVRTWSSSVPRSEAFAALVTFGWSAHSEEGPRKPGKSPRLIACGSRVGAEAPRAAESGIRSLPPHCRTRAAGAGERDGAAERAQAAARAACGPRAHPSRVDVAHCHKYCEVPRAAPDALDSADEPGVLRDVRGQAVRQGLVLPLPFEAGVHSVVHAGVARRP